ncbi:SAM-dependent methyltransferase [Terasakiella sp. SH-1]|uniref:SAM-dependent methyltransferase n=1 Tax=Terasakiella sp. SH-1 TaxID=2560057 RepID=UPI0010745DC9|nr:SAM-dependent methyltransferase [Terasakiella sp. SH-1]
MTTTTNEQYPSYEDHQKAWEELANGIASLKDDVQSLAERGETSAQPKGSLTIIGSGIETLGFSMGDEELIRSADKVLYCVADPATVVWLKRARPDALDLYVLYGENKIRYTTYMQMTEAQLYWVRQGLKVVVVFYGHPGVFVLSTHRAILLARREGHRAIMKAGVCALDTLCADLGVDPCHPGMQTHEATDCLIRQRHIDPTLHVILWQVGLIGELGYRRQGYLNNGFSIFVNWLIDIYGPDYEITHYIGSRYPTIDPMIEVYPLHELHNPEVQEKITGISTFYIAPRDVVATNRDMALQLGVVKKGQELITPKSPLREIGEYGPREMKAFDAFKKFAIPKSYKWQEETAASNFLIELRFDMDLQDEYRYAPVEALEDSRFDNLSERERALLTSRDSGAIQIAAKGAFKRSSENERLIDDLLNSKKDCADIIQLIKSKPVPTARAAFNGWVSDKNYQPDWSQFHSSVDFIYRNSLYPWTGLYMVDEDQQIIITLIGNRKHRQKSILYINDTPIRKFSLKNGSIVWNTQRDVDFNGYLRLDLQGDGTRRLVGKIWTEDEEQGDIPPFYASQVNPQRKDVLPRLLDFIGSTQLDQISGEYVLRSNGRFANTLTAASISPEHMQIDGQDVDWFKITGNVLKWSGGTRDFYSGEISFILDPIIGSVELYGQCRAKEEEETQLKCYGSRTSFLAGEYGGPALPEWAQSSLMKISQDNLSKGGLMLWNKWEKADLTNLTVANLISSIV